MQINFEWMWVSCESQSKIANHFLKSFSDTSTKHLKHIKSNRNFNVIWQNMTRSLPKCIRSQIASSKLFLVWHLRTFALCCNPGEGGAQRKCCRVCNNFTPLFEALQIEWHSYSLASQIKVRTSTIWLWFHGLKPLVDVRMHVKNYASKFSFYCKNSEFPNIWLWEWMQMTWTKWMSWTWMIWLTFDGLTPLIGYLMYAK